MPYGRHLHPDERRHLEDLIKVFFAEKHFEGCGGLEITDEIKVTIGAPDIDCMRVSQNPAAAERASP